MKSRPFEKLQQAGFLAVVFVLSMLCPKQSEAAATGPLRVGAARVDITSLTKGEEPPTGKYDQEHLYVRAIVLDNGVSRAVIIGADTSDMYEGVFDKIAPMVASEVKCPTDNVLMSATHDHSAGSPMGPNPPPSSYFATFGDAILKATREAEAHMQPAKLGFGTGQAYLNVNRDAINPETHLWTQAGNTHAPSDKTVAVLEFVNASTNQPIAVYVNYAMHPVDGYLLGFITADFPGAMSRYVEEAFDNKAVVVYTQGASGDQNPLYLRPSTNGQASRRGLPITGYDMTREPIEGSFRDTKVPVKPIDPAVRDRLERFIESEGAVLGEEVIRVMTLTKPEETNVSIWGAQKTFTCPARKRLDEGREGMAATYADADPLPVRISMIGIGDVAVTGVAGEMYTRIGMRTKAQSPLANTMVVTLANGRTETGYIPDDESYGHQTFQVLGAKLKPGCAEDGIANGLAEMVRQYMHE